MDHASDQFNLSLDSEYDEFDPLADDEVDAENECADAYPQVNDALDDSATSQAAANYADERPAAERISDLFASMAPRRKVLLGILAFCQQPQPIASVNAEVDRLQADNFSVYTAANLCALLERAGAIERVDETGSPAEETAGEPEVVVENGVEYLQPAKPVALFWAITDAGRDALAADQPLERLHTLLDEDAHYAPIYERILHACSAEGGASMPAINSQVDNDPLVQKPRLYAPHFVDKLEKCDALEWRKAWFTTSVGAAGLDLLAARSKEAAGAAPHANTQSHATVEER